MCVKAPRRRLDLYVSARVCVCVRQCFQTKSKMQHIKHNDPKTGRAGVRMWERALKRRCQEDLYQSIKTFQVLEAPGSLVTVNQRLLLSLLKLLFGNRLERGAERDGSAEERSLEDERALMYSRARTQRRRSGTHSALLIWYLQQLQERTLLEGN